MTEAPEVLERECGVLTRFLVGAAPTSYVIRKYREAHEHDLGLWPRDAFDELLLSLMRDSAFFRRPAAAAARAFVPAGAVQAKLVVLLAILESSSPSHAVIDSVPSPRPFGLVLRMVWRGVVWLWAALVGAALLLPARWWLTSRSPSD